MPSRLAAAIKQRKPFASDEEELVLALYMASARVFEPWIRFLKVEAGLTHSQYNVLRILRGARPTRLSCGEISERLVARDPDVTRLVDRLASRGLVGRVPHPRDRRIVEVGITPAGLELLAGLDPAVERFPRAILARLSRAKVRQLRGLLNEAIAELGTFP